MEAQNQNDPNMLRHFSRELAVALNDHELQAYGKMLAEKVREEELAEEKKKQITAEHSNRIKAIRVEIKRIADARAKGEELRPVKCAERLKGNVIEIVRLDRGEVVDTRPADLRDLQTSIPGTGVPDMPTDFDAGENETMGAPPKLVTSSSGAEVFAGAPDDVEVLCDACGNVIEEGDEIATDPNVEAPVHRQCFEELQASGDDTTAARADDIVNTIATEDDEINRRLAERESDPDYGGAQARKTQEAKLAADTKAHEAKSSKPTRERSKSRNEAKNGKPTKKKR